MALPTKKVARKLARKGRRGDTMLAHINPSEANILKMLGGSGTENPKTGLPEFYADSDPAGSDPGSGMGGGSPLGSDAPSGGPSGSDPDREGLGGGPGAPQSGAQPATTGDLGYGGMNLGPTFAADNPTPDFGTGRMSPNQEVSMTERALSMNPMGLAIMAGGKMADMAESLGLSVDRSSAAYGVAERDQGREGGGFQGNERNAGQNTPPGTVASPTELLLAAAQARPRTQIPYAGDPLKYGERAPEHLFFQELATGGPVMGPGGGVDDAIPAVVDGQMPAAISSGEYVVPAAAVAALGDGSSEQGSRKMKALIEMIMKEKYGRTELPRMRKGLSALLNSVN